MRKHLSGSIMKKGPGFSTKSSWLIPVNSCHYFSPAIPLFQPNRVSIQCHDKARSHTARWNLQIRASPRQAHIHIKIRQIPSRTSNTMMLIELWCSAPGWAEALVNSALAWEAVLSTSLLTCKSYGNCCSSVLFACTLSVSLARSLYPLHSCGCNSPASVQRKSSSSSSSSSSREKCKEPRGAPMAPHSHVLSPSPSIISHTTTPNPFLFLSPCPCPSPHAWPQSTRTKQSGGRQCPATTSQPGPWTCVYGTQRMKVRSPCLKTGRWPTQKPAWSISSSK